MTHPAETITRNFLAAIAARDVQQGQALLQDGARIVFPGGAERHSMADIVAGSKAKYQRCDKTFERFDVVPDESGGAVVYCYGTLHGTFADGRGFAGIRFIDRFVVANGKIAEHLVWNDTGITK